MESYDVRVFGYERDSGHGRMEPAGQSGKTKVDETEKETFESFFKLKKRSFSRMVTKQRTMG